MNYIGEIILVGFNFAPQGWAMCDGQQLPIAENEALFQLIGTTYGGDGESTFALPDLRGRAPIHIGQGPGLQSNYLMGETGGVETVTTTIQQIPVHTHAVDLAPMSAVLRCRNAAPTTPSPVGAVPAIEPVGTFTDPALTQRVTVIKATHLTQLRNRVDGARISAGLAAFNYADAAVTPATTIIKAQHIIDLRAALHEVYVTRSLTPPVYTDPALAPGTAVKAVHLTQLRSAANAVPPTALRYSGAAADANQGLSSLTLTGSPTALMTGGTQPHNNMQPYLTLNFCIALFGVFPPQN